MKNGRSSTIARCLLRTVVLFSGGSVETRMFTVRGRDSKLLGQIGVN